MRRFRGAVIDSTRRAELVKPADTRGDTSARRSASDNGELCSAQTAPPLRHRVRRELGRGEVNAPRRPRPVVGQNRGPRRNHPSVQSDTIPRLFEGESAFVMATGPGLNQEVVDRIYDVPDWRYIGISDCYRICPFVDFFYACDDRWWSIHYDKVMEWGGSRNGYWCTETHTKVRRPNLKLVQGRSGKGWSTKQDLIHYGGNSGYQILNIAFLLGVKKMVLVGYNMTLVEKQSHFFGDHPTGLARNSSYHSFAKEFESVNPAAYGVTVINATTPSKLEAFPKMSLEEAIEYELQ